MPTYEYLCQTCSHRFETWQKMTDEPLTVCPECGGHIRRVLFPAGIVFKGSGFYVTDHSNGKSSSTSSSNGESKKSEGATADTKTTSSNTGSSESSTTSTTTATTSSTSTPTT
ncbi:MAG TPA: FmdB family zinc ribbon protein [Dictyobacter sp.]|nr:FmdB family zinc ribbon protein [Dictyobacter sp.]